MSFRNINNNNDSRRQSLRPDNDESTDEIEQEKLNLEEYEKHRLNVEELEHLLQRRQLASKIVVKGYDDNDNFDLNMFLGLEREMSRSVELSSFVKRVDGLIQSHFTTSRRNPKHQKHMADLRNELPVFTRSSSKQFSTTKFLASIQYDNSGRKTSKTLPASGDMTADALISSFFQKQLTNKAFDDWGDTNPKQWTFKVVGSAQYMYGEEFKLSEYEFIQDVLSKATRPLERVDMILMTMDDALKKSSVKRDVRLRDIDMDISYQVERLPEYNYDTIKKDSKVLPLWDVIEPVKCTIVSIVDVVSANLGHAPALAKSVDENSPLTESVFVEAAIQYADSNLVIPRYSQPITLTEGATWDRQLSFDINLCDLPKESVLQLIVYHRKGSSDSAAKLDSDIPIFIVRIPLVDENCRLVTGKKKVQMWPIASGTAPTRVTSVNQFDPACSIVFDLGTYAKPVIFTSKGELPAHLKQSYASYQMEMLRKYPNKMNELIGELEAIVNSDTLFEMNEKDRFKLFHNANKVKDNPKLLPKYLLAVPWRFPRAVQLAHQFLKDWKNIEVMKALELLDVRYSDSEIRLFAVKALSALPDDELNLFLLQLVQCVKNEIYHDSPLCRFLLERAMRSSHLLGHSLFWSLKAELHNSFCKERFVLILEQYLKACTNHRVQLGNQITLVNHLLEFALKVKRFHTKSNEERKNYFQDIIKDYQFKKVVLPLNPRMEVTNLVVEKCKVMGSKKLPLWLVFENGDEPESNRLPVIFKAGDDIRQDSLTLQLLSIMYNLWRQAGMNVHMKIYGCVSCGDMNGFIEVVQNSDTIANITNDYGGSKAVFSKEPLAAWLKEKNKNESDWKGVVDNFARSTAAYCVATYVLGIGDRHNDNIMLQECGDLFHIDFGHFLGNYKKKLNIKRENAPFVFTNMYYYVLVGDLKNEKDSEAYTLFKKLCIEAFNTIRKNGDLIMNLLRLMLGTGIPELQTSNDIAWVQKVIVATIDDKQAGDYFVELIGVSLGNIRTKIMEWTHILSQNIKK